MSATGGGSAGALSRVVAGDLDTITSAALPWDDLAGSGILVTGASGMIPLITVLALNAANDRHGLDLRIYALARSRERAERQYGALLRGGAIEFVEQDVAAPLPELPGVTHIIHGASAAQPKRHATDPVGTLTANILGTHNLLEAARRWGARSFTLMSSAEVYGTRPGNAGTAADPDAGAVLLSEHDYGGIDILDPRACYSEGKRASETFAAVYHAQYGIRYTAARFGHIYGPGLALDDGRVQADFARDVIAGRDITLNSAGLAERTYTYVADAVSGMLTALLRGEPGAYNVSDPAGLTSIRGLAQRFVEARPEKRLSLRFAEPEHRFATSTAQFQGLDSAKLAALGWQPRFGLAAGIDRFLSHLEQLQPGPTQENPRPMK